MRLQSYFSIFFINAQRRHNLLWPWIPLWKYWSYKDHTCPKQPLTFKIFSSLQILHLNNLSLKLLSSGDKNSRSQGEGEVRGRGGGKGNKEWRYWYMSNRSLRRCKLPENSPAFIFHSHPTSFRRKSYTNPSV